MELWNQLTVKDAHPPSSYKVHVTCSMLFSKLFSNSKNQFPKLLKSSWHRQYFAFIPSRFMSIINSQKDNAEECTASIEFGLHVLIAGFNSWLIQQFTLQLQFIRILWVVFQLLFLITFRYILCLSFPHWKMDTSLPFQPDKVQLHLLMFAKQFARIGL